jgi:phosphate-selective porin OprO/OprP
MEPTGRPEDRLEIPMKWLGWIFCALSTLSLPSAAGAQEQETEPATPPTVEERLDEIDQRLRVLDRQTEIEKEAAAEKAKTGAGVTASGKDGFSLKSNDGAFVLKLRGYAQLDGRFFQDDEARPGVDTFLLRRVRPIVEGTVFKIFDFRIMPDFGGGTTVLQDAYLEARFSPAAKLRVGKFKPPVGLERLQSGTDILFVERALPTNLVPNRDLGIQLSGDFAGGAVSYAAGVFNGVADGGSGDLDNNDGKDYAGRLFFQPFLKSSATALRGFGIGVAGSTGEQEGTVAAPGLPSLRTQSQATFFSYRTDGTAAGTAFANGDRTRLSPQLYWYAGPFGLLSEYAISEQEVTRGAVTEKLENTAWQVEASWVIAGGTASYKGVQVKTPFDPAAGTWGAFEIAGRYSGLEVDEDAFPLFANPASSASAATAWGLGFNWYFNKSVRWYVNYELTEFERGATIAGQAGDRPDEKVVLSRFQIAF